MSCHVSTLCSLRNRLLSVEDKIAKIVAFAIRSSLLQDALLRDARLPPTITAIWHEQIRLIENFLARMPLRIVLQPTSVRLPAENRNMPSEHPAALLFLPTGIRNFSDSSDTAPYTTPVNFNPTAPPLPRLEC